MKLSELIERLQELQESIENDPEVVAAFQPNYPLAGEIVGATEIDSVVWIAVGSHPEHMDPYAPREAFQ